jgi:hypothetical protein
MGETYMSEYIRRPAHSGSAGNVKRRSKWRARQRYVPLHQQLVQSIAENPMEVRDYAREGINCLQPVLGPIVHEGRVNNPERLGNNNSIFAGSNTAEDARKYVFLLGSLHALQ